LDRNSGEKDKENIYEFDLRGIYKIFPKIESWTYFHKEKITFISKNEETRASHAKDLKI
jgi:hypothetical protein